METAAFETLMATCNFVATEAPVPVDSAINELGQPFYVTRTDGEVQCHRQGHVSSDSTDSQLIGVLSPVQLDHLGHRRFCQEYGLIYPYVGGSMAKGISSTALVTALATEGMLGFFGAGGLSIKKIEEAILRLQKDCAGRPWGVNLIHSPNHPRHEEATVDLFLRHKVRLIEAAAFVRPTLPLVRYRTAGLHRDETGRIVVPNRVIGKISREEVAEKFCAPPDDKMLTQLQQRGDLSTEQVEMARQISMADALIAEADSGGHTDNRPLATLLPTIMAVRDRVAPNGRIYVGCGGGIGTPQAAAAAFAMGADFIVTGTVNQACIESGTSDAVRQMLADTKQADITMAPAADMFEMGGKVQVVKRGTMFSMRANKLYELYRKYDDWHAVPTAEQNKIETSFFQASFADVWQQTRAHFAEEDPDQIRRAQTDKKHQMALVFRWYLGKSPHWANQGVADRKVDYQIWCGPAMGAFNEWTRHTFLEQPQRRQVVTVALNLLYGAGRLMRANQLRLLGGLVPATSTLINPLTYEELKEQLS